MERGKSFYPAQTLRQISEYEHAEKLFEIGCDQTLFDGLCIAREAALCEKYMGKFPVISISLKDINGADYPSARALLCSVIEMKPSAFTPF